jgi:hypothetical protein
MGRGLRRWLRGYQPHLTFHILHSLVPFSKGSVPHLCHSDRPVLGDRGDCLRRATIGDRTTPA